MKEMLIVCKDNSGYFLQIYSAEQFRQELDNQESVIFKRIFMVEAEVPPGDADPRQFANQLKSLAIARAKTLNRPDLVRWLEIQPF